MKQCIIAAFPIVVFTVGQRVRCSSMIERLLIACWVVRSIPHGGCIKQCIIAVFPTVVFTVGQRARCSSMLERSLIARWVVRSIPHGGYIKQCIIAAFPIVVFTVGQGVRCSSMLEHSLIARWVVRSIPHGGCIKQCIIAYAHLSDCVYTVFMRVCVNMHVCACMYMIMHVCVHTCIYLIVYILCVYVSHNRLQTNLHKLYAMKITEVNQVISINMVATHFNSVLFVVDL